MQKEWNPLGEAAAHWLSSQQAILLTQNIKLLSGACKHDDNQFRDCRTGEELCLAVDNLENAGLCPEEMVLFVHTAPASIMMNGSKALLWQNLSNSGNSLKGYYGHTLGAAGIIESIISIHSLHREMVLPTIGFEQSGVTTNINICDKVQSVRAGSFLKTASGFGGCNAAMIFSKSYS